MKYRQHLIGILSFILLLCVSAQAKQVYVSPTGNDSNTGNIDSPFASVHKAQSVVNAGDTVYIRGGEYRLQESDITGVKQSIISYITILNKSGSPGNLINYWAYPGETPVFNLVDVKPAYNRVACFYVSGRYLHIKGLEITGVQVTITDHTESYCIYSRGNYNIFEEIIMHDNKGTGLRHYKGGHNLFLNCDAYNNHDDVSEDGKGGNTDGFGCHPNADGKGNVFRGCRAWFNSDDGFDCIRSHKAVVFDSCWAFNNGYSQTFDNLGDGTGLKAGGFAYDHVSLIPDSIPVHTIQHCLAVRNKNKGFYSNHHLTGNIWLNNTAYANGYNYDMVNRESPQSQNINVDGYDHVLKNNLSYKAKQGEIRYFDKSKNTSVTNSFDMDIALTDDDFISLDESLLMSPRKADGGLPAIDFMKLSPNSEAIDAGTDIGFPFEGSAPDLGVFESSAITAIKEGVASQQNALIYPNPAKKSINIRTSELIKSLSVYTMDGRMLYSREINSFDHMLDIASLPGDTYLVKINTTANSVTKKFIKW